MLMSSALLLAAFVSVASAVEETDSTVAPSPAPYRTPGTCAPDLTRRDPDEHAILWVKPGTEWDLVWSCTKIGQHNQWPASNAVKGWWRDSEVRVDALGREVGVFWPNAKHECGRCWDEEVPGGAYEYGRLDALNDLEGVTMTLTSEEYDYDAAVAADWTEESNESYPTKTISETCKVVDRTICTRDTLGLEWNEYSTENVAQAISKGGRRGECEHVKLCYGSSGCCLRGEVI